MQVLEQSSEVKTKKAIQDDLQSLQSRIMGLQKKIKEDEESTRKLRREGSSGRLMASPANSVKLTERTFSF